MTAKEGNAGLYLNEITVKEMYCNDPFYSPCRVKFRCNKVPLSTFVVLTFFCLFAT